MQNGAVLSGKLMGSETPRLWTKPLRELNGSTSLGFAAVEFADTVLEIDLDPWQKWLLIHALELREDGSFRFRNVVVLVGRQNGKSLLSQVLSLFFLYCLGTRLILGTAQDLDTATETWQGALDLAESVPELADLMDKPILVNGNKTIRLKTGERYKVKAANRKAGRGLSSDLIILDELREHQNWLAWAAITKTANARPNAQVWSLSNAGDVASVVLRYLRKKAHETLGDPDGINAADDPGLLLVTVPDGEEVEVADDSLGIFEWSAPPGCSIRDRDGWRFSNPSLGYGRVTEGTLRAALLDPEWVFRTEVLCQWSDGTLEGPFPAGAWDKQLDPESHITADSPFVLGVDVSWDRSTTTVAMAGLRADGSTHVEVLAMFTQPEHLLPWLGDPARSARIREASGRIVAPVTLQVSGAPCSSLVEPLEAAGVRVIPWKGTDLGAACGDIYDKVAHGRVWHIGQPVLTVAAAVAVSRPNVDAWVWDRAKSPVDISSLVACTAAAWFVSNEAAANYDVLASVL